MAYVDRTLTATARHPVSAGIRCHPHDRAAEPVILEISIDRARRDRDFGRIEAEIGFLVKEPHRPVRRIRVLTNVPCHGPAPLRERLVADARALMQGRGMHPTAIPRPA